MLLPLAGLTLWSFTKVIVIVNPLRIRQYLNEPENNLVLYFTSTQPRKCYDNTWAGEDRKRENEKSTVWCTTAICARMMKEAIPRADGCMKLRNTWFWVLPKTNGLPMIIIITRNVWGSKKSVSNRRGKISGAGGGGRHFTAPEIAGIK